jgi:DNA-binding response OmpR family regulator
MAVEMKNEKRESADSGNSHSDKLKVKALIAEDDRDLSALIAHDLGKKVSDVRIVHRGDHAIDHILTHPVDIVLLDVAMPGGTGLEVLRKTYDMPNRPIFLVITGTYDFEITRSALQLGAFNYLQKPYSRSEFYSIIDKALAYSRYTALTNQFMGSIMQSLTHHSLNDFLKLPFDQREILLSNVFSLLQQKLVVLESHVQEEATPKKAAS